MRTWHLRHCFSHLPGRVYQSFKELWLFTQEYSTSNPREEAELYLKIHRSGSYYNVHNSQEVEIKLWFSGKQSWPYKELRRETKGQKERYTHLNAELQRMARRDKKSFLSDQGKEIEENNRMGKTRELFKKIWDSKGVFHAKMGTIKNRNGMDLTEAEDIKKRWQELQRRTVQKRS